MGQDRPDCDLLTRPANRCTRDYHHSAIRIAAATQPRYIAERMQIEEFVEGAHYEPTYIRTRLRTVCEDFYRKGYPALFGQVASLEEIIRRLEQTTDDHPYRGALDDLRDIN